MKVLYVTIITTKCKPVCIRIFPAIFWSLEFVGLVSKVPCTLHIVMGQFRNWGNNFRSIFTIKMAFESSIFQLFHDVKFFFLGLILFCYNQLFKRKSKIDFPDFSIFRFFTSHFHSFIKYGKIWRFSKKIFKS